MVLIVSEIHGGIGNSMLLTLLLGVKWVFWCYNVTQKNLYLYECMVSVISVQALLS